MSDPQKAPASRLEPVMLRPLKVVTAIIGALALLLLFDTSGPVSSKGIAANAGIGQEANRTATQKAIDPAAWGSNHVGKPIPEFVHGDECLFCHRNDIGPGWQKNAHGLTIRQNEDAPEFRDVMKGQTLLSSVSPQVEYFMGSRHRLRFLKKEGYGKFAILNTQGELGSNRQVVKWIDADKPAWDKERFANRCAGCHTTAVDASTKAFTAFGLDCYTCHGAVDLNHPNDISLVFLSKKQRSDVKMITSMCAQCHLRMGKSKSTGLPYPNTFVAGDNLFKDYEVDFSKADDPSLNPGDRHVLRNVRDVAVKGIEFPTCIGCHDLHKSSSVKHKRAPRTEICNDCHNAEGPIKGSKPYSVSSALCEY